MYLYLIVIRNLTKPTCSPKNDVASFCLNFFFASFPVTDIVLFPPPFPHFDEVKSAGKMLIFPRGQVSRFPLPRKSPRLQFCIFVTFQPNIGVLPPPIPSLIAIVWYFSYTGEPNM